MTFKISYFADPYEKAYTLLAFTLLAFHFAWKRYPAGKYRMLLYKTRIRRFLTLNFCDRIWNFCTDYVPSSRSVYHCACVHFSGVGGSAPRVHRVRCNGPLLARRSDWSRCNSSQPLRGYSRHASLARNPSRSKFATNFRCKCANTFLSSDARSGGVSVHVGRASS